MVRLLALLQCQLCLHNAVYIPKFKVQPFAHFLHAMVFGMDGANNPVQAFIAPNLDEPAK